MIAQNADDLLGFVLHFVAFDSDRKNDFWNESRSAILEIPLDSFRMRVIYRSLVAQQWLAASGVHGKWSGNCRQVLQRGKSANNSKRSEHAVGKLPSNWNVINITRHGSLLHGLRSQNHCFQVGRHRVGAGLGVGFQLGDFVPALGDAPHNLALNRQRGQGNRSRAKLG